MKNKKKRQKRVSFNLIGKDGCVIMYTVSADEIAEKLGYSISYIYSRCKEGRLIKDYYYVYNDDEDDGIQNHCILYSDTEYDVFSSQWKQVTASILNKLV